MTDKPKCPEGDADKMPDVIFLSQTDDGELSNCRNTGFGNKYYSQVELNRRVASTIREERKLAARFLREQKDEELQVFRACEGRDKNYAGARIELINELLALLK